MTQTIHAPYHFVPLSSWVYMPDWAHLVSHDHPFEQGLSGVLEYELTNATPLLVGANTQRKEGQPALVSWAKDPKGNPIIPGSSLKGMLRNVLEVATFSKFDRVDDHHFAYRDFSPKSSYLNLIQLKNMKSAWLLFDNKQSNWVLRKCQHIALFNDDFNDFNSHAKHKINNNAAQTSEFKYEEWGLNKPAISFTEGNITVRGTKNNNITVPCAQKLGSGNLKGHPVFLGHRPGGAAPSLNYNYMFYAEENGTITIEKESKLVTNMFSAHDKKIIKHLKENSHPTLGIPVFIKEEGGVIKNIGLAKMTKLLYEKSIIQVAKQQQQALQSKAIFDFTDLVLGTLAESGLSLKSRVMFADAHCQHNTGIRKSNPVVLGQPKASYLNAYLEQEGKGDIVSGDLSQYEANSKLTGWKRYPTQQKFNGHLPADQENRPDVQSQLELMGVGAIFKGKVVFHNLKPEELGAVIWALNPDGDKNAFYHGLGHGKSLGAGAVQFKVTLDHCQANNVHEATTELNAESLRQLFVEHMNTVYPATSAAEHAWENSPQVRHLLAFGNKADNEGKNLTYMPLNSKGNEASYSSSKNKNIKQALPAWNVDGTPLSRDESIKPSFYPIGRGRLKVLVERLSGSESFDTEQFRLSQDAEKNELIAKNKADKEKIQAAQIAKASPLYQECLALKFKLDPYYGVVDADALAKRQNISPNLIKLLENSLIPGEQAMQQELQAIYDFLINYELTGFIEKSTPKSKKAKERHRERKAKLDELQTRFNLITKA